MYSNQTLKLKRLQKQQQQLRKQPITNVLVKRDGLLDFHFVIYQLDGQYKDGFYHGLLQMHQNYPFAAPKLFFYTPSGRFQINTPICTSFTNYHQESWTSAWNVRSLLLGTVSFMTSNQASYGCRDDGVTEKKKLAVNSLRYNLKNIKFCQLFLDQLKALRPLPKQLSYNQSQLQIILNKQIQTQKNDQQLINDLQHRIKQGNNQNHINLIENNLNKERKIKRNNNNFCKKLLIGGIVIVVPIAIVAAYLILH